MASNDKLGTYISQLMATVVESDDDFVKELALTELNRLKVNINEFLVKHFEIDDVAKEKTEKQLLQEDKENVNDK
tara:strand:- start:1035 stop:1259 length:225 start_codon:yes stop_codon:yes gene_type:complete